LLVRTGGFMDNNIKQKKEILKDLLLTEEDRLKGLKILVEKAKSLVKIDEKTGKIVISAAYDFAVYEKILLLLIGKYFSKEMDLCDQTSMNIKELEEESLIQKTTLSKPLGGLRYSGYIGEDTEKRYCVYPHRINDIVEALYAKHVEKMSNATDIVVKYKKRGDKKKKRR
jgi:hypothetical protein